MKTTRSIAALICTLLLASCACTRAADTFIEFVDFWVYRDNGVDPGAAWAQPSYNDFEWPIGISQFGFGEGDEFTEVNPSVNAAYFRTYFNISAVGTYSNLTVHLLRDDGAVVYLNGVEVFRNNMPAGAVNYGTTARRNLDGDDESSIAQRVVPASVLVNGLNTLAVEVHQAEGGSDDLSFALELIGHRTGENQPPSANSSFVSVENDRSVSFTLDASDPDSDPLSFTILSSPLHGSLSGTGADRVYTPDAGYVGPDMLSFRATDGEWETEVAFVCIDVKPPSNHPPVADAQTVSGAEDTSLLITLTATDSDGDALTYTHTSPGHGTLSGTGDTLLYQPALNYFGPDSFNFTVDDGRGGIATATVTINVTSVNDVPVVTGQSVVTAEDTALAIMLSGSDVENDALSWSYTQPAHGTVSGSGNNLTYQPALNYYGLDSFSFTANDGNGGLATATVIINVTPVNDAPVANAQSVATTEDTALSIVLNASDVDNDALSWSFTPPAHGSISGSGNNVVYEPALNYYGPDSFTFSVNDHNGGVATATVSINVTPVNDPPTVNAQSLTTDEDTALSILLSGSDIENDVLSWSYTQPAHGTVSGSGNNLTYQPAADYNGPDSFSFTADDGNGGTATATVNITVVPVNDAPVAIAKEAAASDPTNFTRNLVIVATNNQNALVLLNGSDSFDVDGDTLSYAWYLNASATPLSTAANTTVSLPIGSYVLTLVVFDGVLTASDTITVEVFTPCGVVKQLVAQVQAASLKASERNGLLGHLNAACATFGSGNIGAGVYQLELFKARVDNKIAPTDPTLAQTLNQEAQRIIDEVSGQ
jgi:hypothetical protein